MSELLHLMDSRKKFKSKEGLDKDVFYHLSFSIYTLRHVGVFLDAGGPEDIESVGPSKEHLAAVWISCVSALIEFVSLKSVGHVKIPERRPIGTHARKPLPRADPEIRFLIFQNPENQIARKSVPLTIAAERARRAVEAVRRIPRTA